MRSNRISRSVRKLVGFTGSSADACLELLYLGLVYIVVRLETGVDPAVHLVLTYQTCRAIELPHCTGRHHGQFTLDRLIDPQHVVWDVNDAAEEVVSRCQLSALKDIPGCKDAPVSE